MYLNGQGETALTSGPDRHLRRLRSIGWYEFYPSLPLFGSCTSTARGRQRTEDNAKDYLDQLIMAPSELHKTRRRRRRS